MYGSSNIDYEKEKKKMLGKVTEKQQWEMVSQ